MTNRPGYLLTTVCIGPSGFQSAAKIKDNVRTLYHQLTEAHLTEAVVIGLDRVDGKEQAWGRYIINDMNEAEFQPYDREHQFHTGIAYTDQIQPRVIRHMVADNSTKGYKFLPKKQNSAIPGLKYNEAAPE